MGFFKLSEVQAKKPVATAPRCGACGLYKTCASPKMRPNGPAKARIMIVGEAPGQSEDEQGIPFVGKSGEYLRNAVDRVGFDLDDAVLTNSIICRPPGNKTPSEKEIEYCSPNLRETIRSEKPEVIVTLGYSALKAVIGSYWNREIGAMERWVGWQIPLENHWICPTYHPSFLLRMEDRMLDRIFEKHLRDAFAIKQMPPLRPDYESSIELLYEASNINRRVREFCRKPRAAFDFETTCLKPEYQHARIVSCSISDGRETIAFPWSESVRDATSEFIKSPCKKIASNLKMEERWCLEFLGHGVNAWEWDVMLATHCLDNRPGICSLKFQSFVRLGVSSYNENVDPYLEGRGRKTNHVDSKSGHYNRIDEVGMKTLLTYNGMDSILEYELAVVQMEDFGL